MYEDILVATDGQSGTDRAVARGLYLARTFDADIHAVFVLGEDLEGELSDPVRARGEETLAELADWGADLGVTVETVLREGVPAETIGDVAAERDVDLVVMGTRAREAERRYIGSTTQRVLVRSPAPVVAVPLGDEGLPDPGYRAFDRVVIPTDGSDLAERAASHGLRVAAHYGADVRIVYVVDTTTHELVDTSRSILGPLREGGQNAVEEIAGAARDRNLPVSTTILDGTPAEEIRGYVSGTGGDLVAMGTHGTGTTREAILGSTVTRVLRASEVPVLTVNGRQGVGGDPS